MVWADSPDPVGEAHTASIGALTFGSPNFKMLPEPLARDFEFGKLLCIGNAEEAQK